MLFRDFKHVLFKKVLKIVNFAFYFENHNIANNVLIYSLLILVTVVKVILINYRIN